MVSYTEKIVRKEDCLFYGKTYDRFKKLQDYGRYIYPELVIIETDVYLITRQLRIDSRPQILPSISTIFSLSDAIQLLHNHGLYHGDLSTSNFIGCSQNLIAILDWEPNLEVKFRKKNILRTTSYCLHPHDYICGQITMKTDVFALVSLALISGVNPDWRSRLSFDENIRQEVASFIDTYKYLSYQKIIQTAIREFTVKK